MGYYIRVLGKENNTVPVSALREALKRDSINARIDVEDGGDQEWGQVVLAHPDGQAIAAIERNPVTAGELGEEELNEFIEEVQHYRPASAASWLRDYLPGVKVIYAFQLLTGTDTGRGWDAVHAVQSAIWSRVGGILQADSEGFSNEDGYHILWQFGDSVTGEWHMAVLEGDVWKHFVMELGDAGQRAAFLEGRVPPGVKQENA